MSLEQEIEDTKAKLAEALEAEKEPAEEEKEPEKVEEVKEEEEPKEEKVEEKPDDSAFARLRREAAAAKRKSEELERENAELKKPREVEVEETNPVTAELEQVIQEHRTSRAEREFMRFEADVIRADPKNSAIMAEYTQAIQGSIRIQNPRASLMEIAELTKDTLFRKAGKYLNEGYANPVEELLHEAKDLGFTGKSFDPKQEVEEKPQPDMKKVSDNRKRSAGTAGASGESKTDMNRAYIVQNGMPTNEEWQRLTPQQKREILQSA